MIEKKTLWNDAGRSGLVLGCISIAYALAGIGISAISSDSRIMQAASGAVSFILWCVKFVACIYVFRLFMKKEADANRSATNNDTFRFGVATALLSALVYSAFNLAQLLFITPDAMNEALEVIRSSSAGMLTADQLDMLEQMTPKLPVISFFTNLIYCFLFGTVLSAIFSRNIPSRNPFTNNNSAEEQ